MSAARSRRTPTSRSLRPHGGLAWWAVSTRSHLRRVGHQLLDVFGAGRAGRAVPKLGSTTPARKPASPCRRWTPSAGTATSLASGPDNATVCGSTSPTIRRRGNGATRPSCCSTPTPRRWRVRSSGTQPSTVPARQRRPGPQRRRLSVVRAPFGRYHAVLRLGPRPSPQPPWHETVVYEVHVKGFSKRYPDVRVWAAGNPFPVQGREFVVLRRI
jgi:hypothetical protein